MSTPNEITVAKPIPTQAIKAPAPGPEMHSLLKKAAKGDRSCLPEINALLADGLRGKVLTNYNGSSAKWLRRDLAKKSAGKDLLVFRAVRRKIDEVQEPRMNDQRDGLSPAQRQAVKVLAGAESDGAKTAGCEPEAVAGWLRGDPEFIAELNRVRSYRAERLRADVRSLASAAMATLRELISGPDVPPAVRLRASLAILHAANAMKPETIGSTSARGVKASLEHRALLESLGG